jgi:hypothetical protein
MFFEEFLKFFDDLKLFIYTLSISLLLPVLPDCKDTNYFNIHNFLFTLI